MHDEKNQKESAVITVASKRNSKEGRKTMENKSININDESSKKRTKLTVHKVAKGVKGITLIALVVTIIVLLILAGIALNLTIGQNGIFSRAQTAANTWRNAESNEQLAMGELEDWMAGYLEGNGGTEVPAEGTLVRMFLNAEADGCDGTSCSDPENHLHVGDYLQLNTPTSGSSDVATSALTGYSSNQTYTISSTKNNNIRWRVLGVDSTIGGIKLIMETPLESDNADGLLYMYGAQAYETGYLVPDQISEELFGNMQYVEEARSMKVEDMNELFHMANSEIGEYDLFSLENGTGTDYGETYSYDNAYTPSSYLAEKNNNEPEGTRAGTITGTIDGYYYAVASQDMEGIGAPYKIADNQAEYELIFGSESSQMPACFLSSRGVFSDSRNAYFGPGAVVSDEDIGIVASVLDDLFGSDGGEYAYSAYVRSIISLESGVTIQQVPKE